MEASLAFSLIAILISFWTLYRTHLYKKTATRGQIVNLLSESPKDSDSWQFTVAVSNHGNKEVLLTGIDITLDPWPPNTLVPEVSSEQIPLVLKPGEVRLITFDLPDYLIQLGKNENSYIVIEFHPITSDGDVLSLEKRLPPEPEESHEWFRPFELTRLGVGTRR